MAEVQRLFLPSQLACCVRLNRRILLAPFGGVVEWLMAPVLKTGRAQALVGSNPTPSAEIIRRALEFAYTGEVDAERAYQWGMLNHLVSSERLEETTRELCARMIGIPPMVQWISKRIMRAALDSSLETTMVMTSNAGGILQNSEDAKEARRAFMEKRKGQFRGV